MAVSYLDITIRHIHIAPTNYLYRGALMYTSSHSFRGQASKAFTKSLVGVHQKETASTTSIDTVDNDIGAPLGSTCTEDDSTSIDIRKGVNMGVSCPNNKESELMVSSSSDEVDVTRLSVSKVAMSLHEGQEKHLTAWGPSPSSPLSQTK